MISNINNWNLVDKVIHSIETAATRVVVFFRNEKTPDPEEMILAATKHLQAENEMLKEFRIPDKLIFDEESATYICPKCSMELGQELIEGYKIKFCIECGKRLFRYR